LRIRLPKPETAWHQVVYSAILLSGGIAIGLIWRSSSSALTILSALATVAMALFSGLLLVSNERFRKWTVLQHEPIPQIVSGKIMFVTRPGRKFEFTLHVSNLGEGPIVISGVAITRWNEIEFSSITISTMLKFIKPHELIDIEFVLPLADFPQGANLQECFDASKRSELEIAVQYQAGTSGIRTTSVKLTAMWYKPPFEGLAEGIALLWPSAST